MDKFVDLQLDSKIIKTLNSIGFEKPTPIQLEAIPKALEGLDIIASAQTGTGKTGAFLLPALHALAQNPSENSQGPYALILVPTRELAEQVSKEAMRFSKHLPNVKTVCIYGGMPYPQQNRALSRPYHILVATPGRLLDHLERGRINLSKLSYFVLDEADRMLDMGFINDVETIASKAPKSRQTLMFSATIDRNVMKISQKLQKNPYQITMDNDPSKEAKIDQKLYYVDNINHKMRLLETLLEDPSLKQAIVFTSTKAQADKLSYSLKDKGFQSAPLHGDINQRKRNDTLKRLRTGHIQILVATDIAARGIDVLALSHVFNFDIPRQAEDFVHRIGRTGRAGGSGVAITFATYSEGKILNEIDKLTGKEMDICTVEGMEPKPKPKYVAEVESRSRRFGGRRNKLLGSGSFNRRGGRGSSNFKKRDEMSHSESSPRFSESRKSQFQEDRGPRSEERETYHKKREGNFSSGRNYQDSRNSPNTEERAPRKGPKPQRHKSSFGQDSSRGSDREFKTYTRKRSPGQFSAKQ